jgi:hypothetical protein
MFVPFHTLPATSRVWIYQSSRILTASEQAELQNALRDFISTWTAHQAGLKGSAEIRHGLFVIIAVDEGHNHASGCSIDKSVHFMKEAGKHLGIDFFDRLTAACMKPDGSVVLFKAHQIASLLEQGVVQNDATIFNNLIESMEALNHKWMVPMSESWLSNFLPKENQHQKQ